MCHSLKSRQRNPAYFFQKKRTSQHLRKAQAMPARLASSHEGCRLLPSIRPMPLFYSIGAGRRWRGRKCRTRARERSSSTRRRRREARRRDRQRQSHRRRRGHRPRPAGARGRERESERPRTKARASARHTHTIHDDTTGPECGDCMLVDGGSGAETPRGLSAADPPTVASPPSNG